MQLEILEYYINSSVDLFIALLLEANPLYVVEVSTLCHRDLLICHQSGKCGGLMQTWKTTRFGGQHLGHEHKKRKLNGNNNK